MMSNKFNTTNRIWIVIILCFLISGTLFCFYLWPRNPIPSSENAVNDAKLQQSILQAHKFRDGLEPWAMKNSSLLKKMLSSEVNNKDIMNIIWSEAPHILKINNPDVSKPPNPDEVYLQGTNIFIKDMQKPIRFTMFAGIDEFHKRERRIETTDPEMLKETSKINMNQEARKDFYWRKFRDLPYLISSDAGESLVILWITGKITIQKQRTDLHLDDIKNLKVVEEVCDYKDIKGMYKFLDYR